MHKQRASNEFCFILFNSLYACNSLTKSWSQLAVIWVISEFWLIVLFTTGPLFLKFFMRPNCQNISHQNNNDCTVIFFGNFDHCFMPNFWVKDELREKERTFSKDLERFSKLQIRIFSFVQKLFCSTYLNVPF